MLGVMAGLTVPGLAEILLDRRARVLGPAGLVHETLSIVCADPSRVPSEVVDAHVQLMRERDRLGRQNGRAFLQASRSIGLRMADPRFWTQVAKVRAPTLVIHGSLDRLIPVAAAKELVRRRPDWTLKILEGVGHVPMMETPDLFMQALNEWGTYRIAADGRHAAVNY
jgi:pimeloyl-ACP methyl ester carboxylesterase